MNVTKFAHLKKPSTTERYNVDTFNDNSEIIDQQFEHCGELNEQLTSKLTCHTDNETVHILPEERTAWNNKQDAQEGKGLSSNDYTNEEKAKLQAIENNANYYIHPTTHPAALIVPDAQHQFVSASEKELWNGIYEQSADYTDQKIADLINGAPSTLDTLGEIAEAMQDNADVVSVLDDAIGKKATQAELNTHTGNSIIHVTAQDRFNWNDKVGPIEFSLHTHSKADIGLGNVDNTSDADKRVEFANSSGTSGSCTGNAATATALTSNAGSAAQPVYFSGGKPVVCTAYADARVGYASSADSAVKAMQDGNGNSIAATYLPKTGGTITGNLQVSENIAANSVIIDNSVSIDSSGNWLILGSNTGVTCRRKDDINVGVELTASAFNIWSSRLTKENITSMTETEAKKLLNVEIVDFDYKEKYGGKKNQHGVIAEDVASIIPSAVTMPEGSGVINEASTNIPTVDYSKFVPYLIKMVQIQQKEIEAIKAKSVNKQKLTNLSSQ